MKRISLLLLSFTIILFSGISLFSQPNTGNFTMQYTDRGTTSYIYYWVPADYDSTKKYPFLLAWHGSGDNGDNNRNFFRILLASRIGAILVCPDVNNIINEMQQDATYLTNLTAASYNYTLSNYNIDTNKIVIMGFSMGGGFAYQLGLANPTMFRGIIGLAPAIGQLDQTLWSNIKKLRMATILGDKDFNFAAVNSLMNSIKDSNADLLYLIKPGVQHVDNNYFNSQAIIDDLRQCYDFVILRENSPIISLNKNDIDFDTTFIGNQKTISFEISNTGSANLVINDINIVNDPDTVFSISGIITNITIPPGSKQTLDVLFKPKSEITYTGQISISSNDTENPTMNLQLNGTGYSLKVLIESSDTVLNYGNVKLNETRNLDFRIYNTGNQNLNISAITLENIPDNVINFPSLQFPLLISPAAYYTFTIGFSPKDTVNYLGRIKINSNATNFPDLYINISGKGIAATDVEDISDENSFSMNIVPNPVENQSIISFNYFGNKPEKLQLLLVDIKGNFINEIYNKIINNSETNLEIKTDDLTNGIYFIIAKISDRILTKPLFIIR